MYLYFSHPLAVLFVDLPAGPGAQARLRSSAAAGAAPDEHHQRHSGPTIDIILRGIVSREKNLVEGPKIRYILFE